MRVIDADALKIDYGFTWDDITPTHEEMYALIDRQPTIDAVKHGRWKYISFLTVECSECKTQIHDLEYSNFCPSCGARMDAETRNNTEEKLQ